jgi:hypothetical protein
MEFSTYVIWDVILNAIGYLAAGALSAVLYHMIRSRRRGERALEAFEEGEAAGSVCEKDVVDDMPFVSLEREPGVPKKSVTYRKRDRGEVLLEARNLLRLGESNESIRRSLPVSEAELALLRYEMK